MRLEPCRASDLWARRLANWTTDHRSSRVESEPTIDHKAPTWPPVPRLRIGPARCEAGFDRLERLMRPC